ncbi:hypothetical protein HanIR_Chr02g0067641 [Helianthus annuus]|nr:hypothetical protein HanIR_Chr02g0067641 [Helianthus annuus]
MGSMAHRLLYATVKLSKLVVFEVICRIIVAHNYTMMGVTPRGAKRVGFAGSI